MTAEDHGFEVSAIGVVANSRSELVDDHWASLESTITLATDFDARSVAGLDEFSHVEVLFVFHRVDPGDVCLTSRHPRGNRQWPEVGIFAQRAKDRPNRIGSCTCELLSVDGNTLTVRGLDAIDGTPVIDIKPYLREFGPRGPLRQPRWATELMADYFG